MQIKSLILGGLIPALLLGAGSVLMKLSMRAGSSVPNYLAQVGAAVLLVGLCSSVVTGGWVSSMRAWAFASAMGVGWAVAIGAMAYSMTALQMPVSIIAPLTNTNALVAVALSALLLKEWQTLDMVRLAGGTLLLMGGVYVITTAQKG